MNQSQNMASLSNTEQYIFSIAKGILENTIDLLEGSRLLARYRSKIDRLKDELLFFSGIASQADVFPLSEAERKQWAPDALARLDKEREEFLYDTEKLIRENCNSILQKLSAN